MPGNAQPLLAAEGSTAHMRAGFARSSLWVTQADDSHRWPGGDYPLQNPQPGGLPEWAEQVTGPQCSERRHQAGTAVLRVAALSDAQHRCGVMSCFQ